MVEPTIRAWFGVDGVEVEAETIDPETVTDLIAVTQRPWRDDDPVHEYRVFWHEGLGSDAVWTPWGTMTGPRDALVAAVVNHLIQTV